MPWMETCLMEQRTRFVFEAQKAQLSISELCRQYGVSRKTGYKWLGRYGRDGLAGLSERSRAPLHTPHAMSEAVMASILALRKKHPTWGPKKLRARLAMLEPQTHWPAISSIGDLLAREGLVHRRRRRNRVPGVTRPFAPCRQANDLWCMDFKGWFLTGDGEKCEPFTLIDGSSRFLLRCQAVKRNDVHTVWPLLRACFYEFGLPMAIRSDNGPPFASVAAGRLSPLAVKLIKAGVLPDHIDPASPAQNGRLERLHRTLKQDTINPPARNRAAQNRRFQRFCKIYNQQRPHEALDMDVPQNRFRASLRRWSGRLRSPEYGADVIVRRVRSNGEIKWNGTLIYISCTLAGEPISLDEAEHGLWTLRFGPVLLGTINSKNLFCKPAPRKRDYRLQNKEQS